LEKPQLVVLTKLDVSEVREQVPEVQALFAARGRRCFALSAVTGEGVKELVHVVGEQLEALRRPAETSSGTPPMP